LLHPSKGALKCAYRNLTMLYFSSQHFEQDDPELYLRKIKFILDNDVDGMELTFSEEEYDHTGKLVKVHKLSYNIFRILTGNDLMTVVFYILDYRSHR